MGREYIPSDKKRMRNRAARRRRRMLRRIRIVVLEIIIIMILLVIFWKAKGKGEVSVSEIVSPKTGKEAVEQYAKAHGLTIEDYPQDLIELYERNPETKDFVCEYPLKKDKEYRINIEKDVKKGSVPLFMQWDERWGYQTYSGNVMGLTGCGPTCLSMIAVYLSGDTDKNPLWMANFATENGYASEGNGSAWTLFSEGGKQLGFDVKEIPLDEQRIIDNLEVNNPIVAVMRPGDFTTTGHFIVFTGYKDGKIQVNDPNSRENSKKLWDYDDISGQIKQLWVFRE